MVMREFLVGCMSIIGHILCDDPTIWILLHPSTSRIENKCFSFWTLTTLKHQAKCISLSVRDRLDVAREWEWETHRVRVN